MSLIETEALILKNYSLQEADKIVLFLTRTHGLVRGVARGAKRLKSRFGSTLEPFTIINLAYFQKEERELVSIRQTEIQKSLFEKAGQVENLKTFSYLAELLSEFAPPNEPNELLYRMTIACLETAKEENLAKLRLYFEIWLLKLGGFFPSWNNCEACMRQFSAEENAFFITNFHLQCVDCQKNRGNWIVTSKQRAIVQQVHTISPSKFFELNLSEDDILQVSRITKRIISHVLGKEI
jgi:DNA repair protein RecO (recombination protein O)